MAYSGDLLTIDGNKIVGLKTYEVQYNKLWKDSERNMAGNMSASLIGVFTKLVLTFRAGLTEEQISSIQQTFNQSYFNATYYDTETRSLKTERFYASDVTAKLLNKAFAIYDTFNISIIATSKRS